MGDTKEQQQLVIAVTGHRPDKLPDKATGYQIPNPHYDLVVEGLYQAFHYYKPAYVISGMALGVDQWAAELCLNMNIPFIAALPFEGQEKKWPPKSQAKFHWLLSRAAVKYVICEGGFEPWKMQQRNKWMIDSCHMVVAVWNGSHGGTANCVGYAVQQAKFIHYVPLPPAGMAVGEFFEKIYGTHSKGSTQNTEAATTGTQKRIVEI